MNEEKRKLEEAIKKLINDYEKNNEELEVLSVSIEDEGMCYVGQKPKKAVFAFIKVR
jgi:hypothetical protein